MSLWGTDELYLQGAICNARLAATIYPGWTLRAYCSPEVPVLDLLRSLGVDVRTVPSSPGYAGLFWRFLPAADAEVDHVIIRDADSRLNVREKAAVDAWIASGRPFHVMRDHAHHRRTPMLAGMWGCRGGSIPDMRDRIARFERGAGKRDDEEFLREEIWPLVSRRCLVHSSVPEPLGGDAFPSHPAFEGFVGEIVDPPEVRDLVALLLPSRGRPAAALAAARSALTTAAAPEQLRVVVGVEPDDAGRYRQAFGDDAAWIHVLQSGGNYVRAMRELHRSTTAGIYGLCADDFVFETPGWDRQIRFAAAHLPERLGLIYADDGIQRERLATAPFLTAEWIACVADILPGNYEHMFCDTEVTDIARRAGLLRFLPDVRITHRHHIVGEAAFDATYARSAATTAAGGAEFERRADARQRLADRLAHASRAPVLSILISTLVQHVHRLDELLVALRRQIEALVDPSVVEILAEPDAGERSTAAKRKSLLARAQGRWVVFVDDDETVADDAVAVILRAMEQDVDGVTFGQPAEFGFRTSRIVALRRTVALAVARSDATGREDFRWSGTMSQFLKREAKIDQIVILNDRPPERGIRSAEAADMRSTLRLPSLQQQLLLTAALAADEVALRAWADWVAEVGPELADPDSTRLFPLVWWNLQRLGAEGIAVNSLKPSYWHSWALSLERMQLAGEVAGALQTAGIPTLLVKGVALASRYYERPELRPPGNVALLVPAPCAVAARRLLVTAGWQPTANPLGGARPRSRGRRFKDRAGRRLTLHWHAFVGSSRAATDDGFWARAEPVNIDGTTTRVLAPADQMLQVCVDGLRTSDVHATRWVADAMAILNSAAERMDWDLLVEEARARRVVRPMRRALDYVRGAFGVAALDRVCRQLQRERAGA